MQCFRKFPVAKKFIWYQDFPSNFFVSGPKNFAGTLCWKFPLASITIFRRKFFVSVPKNFAGEPFCAISEFSGTEKVYG